MSNALLPTLAEVEADHIRLVLAATRGNVSKSAEILGIERTTLYRRLRKLPGMRRLLETVRHYVETPPTVQEVDV